MTKKRFTLWLLALALLVGACASRGPEDGKYMSPAVSEPAPSDKTEEAVYDGREPGEVAVPGDGATGNVFKSQVQSDKLITTSRMVMETLNYDETVKGIDGLIITNAGYVQNAHSSTEYYNSKAYRYTTYDIRIPQENMQTFKSGIKGEWGLVTENATSVEDVTKHYTDSESRIAVLTTKETRLLALLDQAATMEDIIALENALSNTIEEKERLKSDLKTLDDRIAYSTLSLVIKETSRLSNQETVETSFGERLSNAFVSTWYNFVEGVKNGIITLVFALPILISLIVLLLVGSVIWKKTGRRSPFGLLKGKLFKGRKAKKGTIEDKVEEPIEKDEVNAEKKKEDNP